MKVGTGISKYFTFERIERKPGGVDLHRLVLHNLKGPVLEELRRDEVRLADGVEEGVLAHVLHQDLLGEAGLEGAYGGLAVRTIGQAPIDHSLEQSAFRHLMGGGKN